MQGVKKRQVKAERHDEEWHDAVGRDRRPIEPEHRSRLMQVFHQSTENLMIGRISGPHQGQDPADLAARPEIVDRAP